MNKLTSNIIVLLLLLIPLWTHAEVPKKRLVVLTSYPEEVFSRFEAAFEKQHPDVNVDILWQRPLGDVSLLEKEKVDVYWAPSRQNFIQLSQAGAFQKLTLDRSGLAERIGHFLLADPNGYYLATEMAGFGFVINPEYLQQHQLPAPKTWFDLAQPIYATHLAFPIPSKVGFAPAIIDFILQAYGWQAGWALLSEIVANAHLMDFSQGETVVDRIAGGKNGIGLSIDFFVAAKIANGATLSFTYPKITAYSPAYVAITAKTTARPEAQQFVEFLLSDSGQKTLFDPDIRKLPVRPAIYQDAPKGYYNPFVAIQAMNNFVFDNPFITYNDVNDTGHGTHVAGTIAAVNNNGFGVAGVAGGDFANGVGGVKIMSCQLFSGNYGATLYNEARAIKYAADNGAVILQCSWGYNSALANPGMFYPGPETDKEWASMYPLEKEALDYFINYAGSPNGVIQGGLAIFAAGNEGAGMPAYPSAYNECVSVASVDAAGYPSNFTNFGERVKISAPGGDSDFHEGVKGKILSTVPSLGQSLEKSSYGYMEGTSMACPTVSGVAALGLSYAVQQRRHFKVADFRKLMYEACKPIDDKFTDTKYYWNLYEYYGKNTLLSLELSNYKGKMGYGLIDAGALLTKIGGGAGVAMRVPNTTVSLKATTKLNFAPYFMAGEGLTYSCKIADTSFASIAIAGATATITGLKTGSVKATVTASNGKVQEFLITVRNQAGNNGWM